jgi:TRAP-type C4-dicarboxylate transport system permease small subunit
MNPKQIAVRFAILIFWMFVIGMGVEVSKVFDNLHALGWQTWLIYGAIAVAGLYAGIAFTIKLWNSK